jgi:hypothetical protein
MKCRGELPFIRVARGGVRFHPDDIAAYIEKNWQLKERKKNK